MLFTTQASTALHDSPLIAVEVWQLEDECVWTCASALYGQYDALRDATVDYRYNLDHRLFDEVVQRKSVVISTNLFNGVSARDHRARELGATVAMAIPVVRPTGVTSVLLFLLPAESEEQAAFEVWSRSDRDELGLTASHYLNLEFFARISPFVKFPRGSGLPGDVWDRRFTKMLSNLGTSPNFMRAAGAKAEGLNVGVGIPIMRAQHDLECVAVLLSSREAPIAKAFEAWAVDPDADTDTMRLESSIYPQGAGAFRRLSKEAYFCPGEGLVGKVWQSQMPIAVSDLQQFESSRAEAAREAGLSAAVGFPIGAGHFVRGVLVMYL